VARPNGRLPGAAERSELTDLCWPSVQAPDCGEPQVFGDLALATIRSRAGCLSLSGRSRLPQ